MCTQPTPHELLANARRLASQADNHTAASNAYSNYLDHAGHSEMVSMEYARFLIHHSQGREAAVILRQILEHNGANIDALELFLELVRELDLPPSHQRWAFKRLGEDIAAHPSSLRGSLDYAIPSRLHGILAMAATSTDPVTRAAAHINQAYILKADTAPAIHLAERELGKNDVMRAHLTVTLGRGNRNKSVALLKDANPRAVPMNSLRRAIRRAITGNKFDQALAYLRVHVKLKPKDAWSRQKLNELQQAHMGNDVLLDKGFPLPARAPVPTYKPIPNRILYTLHNSLPYHSAGYATRTHGLLSELNRTGWDVEGVTRLGYPYDMPGHHDIANVAPSDTIGNTTYHRLLRGRDIEKKRPLTNYVERYISSLLELVDQERPALLHGASNHWNGLATIAAANKRGIPSIYEIRGLWEVTRSSRDPDWAKSDMYELMARMETDAARGASKVFTITEALRTEMIARGIEADHIEVLPNGVDSERFVPLPPDGELAEEIGLTGETVIGYVGSILDYEGIDLLIKASSRLARSRDDFRVVIVGDGPERERLEFDVDSLGLNGIVTFTGRVPHEEVERYYSLIDITPFPRLPLPVCEMVSPLKPFEAMAMGKAVVASNVDALAEIVKPHETGLLHSKGSVESLAHELATLLDDHSLIRRLGDNGRKWVVAERDWRLLSQRLADTYQTLVE